MLVLKDYLVALSIFVNQPIVYFGKIVALTEVYYLSLSRERNEFFQIKPRELIRLRLIHQYPKNFSLTIVEHCPHHIYSLLLPLIFQNYLRHVDQDTKNLYKLKILLK